MSRFQKIGLLSIAASIITYLVLRPLPNKGNQASTAGKPLPVTIAAMTGNVAMLNELVRSGADINAQDAMRFGWTPLITAAYFRQTNIIKFLLDNNAEISKKDRSGETALMHAITNGDTNSAVLLIQDGSKLHEDWLTISNLVKIKPTSQCWFTIFKQYIGTNSAVLPMRSK